MFKIFIFKEKILTNKLKFLASIGDQENEWNEHKNVEQNSI